MRSAAFATFLAALLIVRHFVRLRPRGMNPCRRAMGLCERPLEADVSAAAQSLGDYPAQCRSLTMSPGSVSFVFLFLKGLFNFVHFLGNCMAVSAHAMHFKNIRCRHIFYKGKKKRNVKAHPEG